VCHGRSCPAVRMTPKTFARRGKARRATRVGATLNTYPAASGAEGEKKSHTGGLRLVNPAIKWRGYTPLARGEGP